MKLSAPLGSASEVTARIVLCLSALVAVAIAAAIILAPGAFYSDYGIDILGNATLASELKASAGALLVAGLAMFSGVVRPARLPVSLAIAAAVYLSYGLTRVASFVLDGLPHDGMVAAAAIEIVIGTVSLACWLQLRYSDSQRGDGLAGRDAVRSRYTSRPAAARRPACPKE